MTIPSQTVVAILVKELFGGIKEKTVVSLMSTEPKILQMIRYEILKLQWETSICNEWSFKGLPGCL
jgi:hypothetical protein